MPREEDTEKRLDLLLENLAVPPGHKGRSGDEVQKRGQSIRALPKELTPDIRLHPPIFS